jgi:hypothetical protein
LVNKLIDTSDARWKHEDKEQAISPYTNNYYKKGRIHPRTGHEGLEGEQSYSFTLTLISALDGSEWLSHVHSALPPGTTRWPLYRRLGGAKGMFGRVLQISPTTGIRSPDRSARSELLYRLSYPGELLLHYGKKAHCSINVRRFKDNVSIADVAYEKMGRATHDEQEWYGWRGMVMAYLTELSIRWLKRLKTWRQTTVQFTLRLRHELDTPHTQASGISTVTIHSVTVMQLP